MKYLKRFNFSNNYKGENREIKYTSVVKQIPIFSNEVKYNESVNIEEVHQEIFDILVELRDDGFEIDLYSPTSDFVDIRLYKEDDFTWKDVEEYVNRITEYLSSLGYKLSKGYGKNWRHRSPDFRITVFYLLFESSVEKKDEEISHNSIALFNI